VAYNKLAGAALLSLLAAGGAGAARAAAPCLQYAPAQVALKGTLHRKTYPGPPNFESVKHGDAAETGFYLALARPICTSAGKDAEESGVAGVKQVQLILSQAQYDQLRPQLGRVIELRGALHEADNGHHHAPVLLAVKP
jgi:hypothetical protein